MGRKVLIVDDAAYENDVERHLTKGGYEIIGKLKTGSCHQKI